MRTSLAFDANGQYAAADRGKRYHCDLIMDAMSFLDFLLFSLYGKESEKTKRGSCKYY